MAIDLEKWKFRRQRCRTDLFYLCKVLGYVDVNPKVHGQLVDNLQKFKGGIDHVEEKRVANVTGIALPSAKAIIEGYKPACDLWDLEGPRRRLNMIPRGHLKTTVVTFAHTIQWIINYPNVRILLSTHTDGAAKQFINELRKHFTNSDDFRLLFPEHVPHGKGVNDFGNQEHFDTCARTLWRKEHTVQFVTVGSSIASVHFEVTKHDDIVDKENVRTPEQIQVVKDHLGMCGPLVETHAHPVRGEMDGWVDLTGTFYDYCLVAGTRILMSDFTHKPIEQVAEGDMVIGWETRKHGRRYIRPARVTHTGKHTAMPVNRYIFESGMSVTSTEDHRWWAGKCWNKGPYAEEYRKIGMGSHRARAVRRLLFPIEKSESRDAGWLAGFFDGEGTTRKNKRYSSGQISICQSMHNPGLIERAREVLAQFGIEFHECWWSPSKRGGKPHWHDRCNFTLNGGWRGRYKFLALIDPERKKKIIEGLYANLQTSEDKLVAVEPAGAEDVYFFGTETGNYIAEGLCSKNSDVNYSIYEIESDKALEKRIWSLNVQSAAPNWPEGPYLWPERCGYKKLKSIEDDPAEGPGVLSSQYLLNPTPKGSGLVEDESEIVWTPRKVMNELYARFVLNVTVDLAGMDVNAKRTADNDFTVLNLSGFGTDGHIYVLELIHGKPTPHQVIEHMFDLYKRHPRIQSFKIPKDHFTRVLLPFLKAEEVKRGIWLPIMEISISNQTSKKQKIKGLQPWFQRGMIHWADDLPCKQWIRWEILKFPKFAHDDILDTTFDQMESRDGGITSDVMASGRPEIGPQRKVMEIGAPDGTKQVIAVDVPIHQVTREFLFQEESGTFDDITGWGN